MGCSMIPQTTVLVDLTAESTGSSSSGVNESTNQQLPHSTTDSSLRGTSTPATSLRQPDTAQQATAWDMSRTRGYHQQRESQAHIAAGLRNIESNNVQNTGDQQNWPSIYQSTNLVEAGQQRRSRSARQRAIRRSEGETRTADNAFALADVTRIISDNVEGPGVNALLGALHGRVHNLLRRQSERIYESTTRITTRNVHIAEQALRHDHHTVRPIREFDYVNMNQVVETRRRIEEQQGGTSVTERDRISLTPDDEQPSAAMLARESRENDPDWLRESAAFRRGVGARPAGTPLYALLGNLEQSEHLQRRPSASAQERAIMSACTQADREAAD